MVWEQRHPPLRPLDSLAAALHRRHSQRLHQHPHRHPLLHHCNHRHPSRCQHGDKDRKRNSIWSRALISQMCPCRLWHTCPRPRVSEAMWATLIDPLLFLVFSSSSCCTASSRWPTASHQFSWSSRNTCQRSGVIQRRINESWRRWSLSLTFRWAVADSCWLRGGSARRDIPSERLRPAAGSSEPNAADLHSPCGARRLENQNTVTLVSIKGIQWHSWWRQFCSNLWWRTSCRTSWRCSSLRSWVQAGRCVCSGRAPRRRTWQNMPARTQTAS